MSGSPTCRVLLSSAIILAGGSTGWIRTSIDDPVNPTGVRERNQERSQPWFRGSGNRHVQRDPCSSGARYSEDERDHRRLVPRLLQRLPQADPDDQHGSDQSLQLENQFIQWNPWSVSAAGEAIVPFRNRRQAIFHDKSMIFRKIMHEPSGVICAFDQVLVFPSRDRRAGQSVEDRHHVPGKK